MGLLDNIAPLARLGRRSALQRSYDTVAEAYVENIYHELDEKPADRRLLDTFAESLQGAGRCVDLGCGPGHITRYLHERGVDIEGIDISRAMLQQAHKLNPGISFSQGDMRALKADDDQWSAAIALYSIIHIEPAELMRTLLEWQRVLKPGGRLLIGFHVGMDKQHLDTWWDHSVDLDFHYYRTTDMLVNLQQAGFAEVSVLGRPPYPHEAQTRRGYILAEALPGIPATRRRITGG